MRSPIPRAARQKSNRWTMSSLHLFKEHPNVPVMTSMWTPRHDIYGARPYWIDDPLLGETFTRAEIKALENPKTPREAPQTWATGPVPRSVQRLKAARLRFALGPTWAEACRLNTTPRLRQERTDENWRQRQLLAG